jgi:hypothetical protein
MDELRCAARAIEPNGYLFVEVTRRPLSFDHFFSGTIANRITGVRRYRAEIKRLQLSEPQFHWHWPDFESCTEIIPLGDRAAGICALQRRGSGRGSRWKSTLARLLLETRSLVHLVPCFSLLTQRPR